MRSTPLFARPAAPRRRRGRGPQSIVPLRGDQAGCPLSDADPVLLSRSRRARARSSGAAGRQGAVVACLGAVSTGRPTETRKFSLIVSPEKPMPLRIRGRSLPSCALFFLGLAALHPAVAQVTYIVDSVLDQIDDDTSDGVCHTAADTCTLRAAVMQANLASGAGATIQLPAATYTLVRPASGANGPDNGDLNFTTPASGDPRITLLGAGESATIIDANQIDRVLTVETGRSATLSRVTLRNGYRSGPNSESGGGIYNQGLLILDHATVADNVIDGRGGGIYNDGALDLNDSTVRGNLATTFGGGVFSELALRLLRTTVDENTANDSGRRNHRIRRLPECRRQHHQPEHQPLLRRWNCRVRPPDRLQLDHLAQQRRLRRGRRFTPPSATSTARRSLSTAPPWTRTRAGGAAASTSTAPGPSTSRTRWWWGTPFSTRSSTTTATAP